MREYIKNSKLNGDFSKEGIHEKRVIFRKIEAVCYLSKIKKLEEKRREYGKIFKKLGKLRDLKLEIENIEEMSEKESEIKIFQNSLKKEFEIEMEKIKKSREWFSEKFIEEVKNVLLKIGKEDIEKALLTLGKRAEKCLKKIKLDSKKIHKARKILKIVRYSLEIAYEKEFTEQEKLEKAKEIQELFGNYIDSRGLYLRFAEFEKNRAENMKLKEYFKENADKKYIEIVENRSRIKSEILEICRL